MGMKKKTGVREQSIPGKKQLSEANRNNAGNCFADAIESTEGIEWESRDIALSDIRINDDNAIFRSLVMAYYIIWLFFRSSKVKKRSMCCSLVNAAIGR